MKPSAALPPIFGPVSLDRLYTNSSVPIFLIQRTQGFHLLLYDVTHVTFTQISGTFATILLAYQITVRWFKVCCYYISCLSLHCHAIQRMLLLCYLVITSLLRGLTHASTILLAYQFTATRFNVCFYYVIWLSLHCHVI